MKSAIAAPDTSGSPTVPQTTTPPHSWFGCLRVRNFRLYASGQLISFTGSWVQRITQDWLVLTLTGSVTAVGITVALQQLPTLLFGLLGGVIADRYPRRRVLQVTQGTMVATSGVLGYLALTHQVTAWHVYVLAFVLGVAIALDNPARQAFVNEMVGPDLLRSGIGLNSAIFQLGALIGPAISGLLIGAVGAGYLFAANAVCGLVPIGMLALMRGDELIRTPIARDEARRLTEVLRYVLSRPAMLWPIVLVGVYGMFTANLGVTLASYAQSVFRSGASGYGLLSSVVAVGAIVGALISMRRRRAGLDGLTATGLTLATLYMVSAAAPTQWSYGILLVAVGAVTLLLHTSANSMVQLAAPDARRGRVMALYLLVFFGTAAIGGPLIGAIDEHLGPRAGMLLAGAIPGSATIAIVAARRRRHSRAHRDVVAAN